MPFDAIITGAILVVLIILLGVILLRRRRLSAGARKRYQVLWNALEAREDPVRRLVEADALLSRALRESGYAGSLADQLKSIQGRIPNKESVWKAHKLRNRLVHEPGTAVDDRGVSCAVASFKKALESLY
ncbi:MAG: hypothetical protein WCX61_02565 [Candidatus Peribacteraceae bacterium]